MATVTKTLTVGNPAGALCVSLNQPDGSTVPVTVAIRARTGAQLYNLSTARVLSPAADSPPRGGKRIVAFADVPGVVTWEVQADTAGVEALDLELSQGEIALALAQPVTWVGAGSSPPSANTQPDSLIWVGTNGDDTTGTRGDIGKPFLTIGAAILAARAAQPAPSEILVAAGDYLESVVVTAGDGQLSNLTITGQGVVTWRGGAQPALFVRSLDPADNANITNWRIRNIRFALDTSQAGLRCQGAPNLVPGSISLFGTSTTSQGLFLENVSFIGCTFDFRYLGGVIMDLCNSPDGVIDAVIDTCNLSVVNNGSINNGLIWTYDGSVHQGEGRGPAIAKSGAIFSGGVTWYGAPFYFDDESVNYFGVFGSGGLACYYDGSRNIDLAPQFNLAGSFGNDFFLSFPAENPSGFATARPAISGVGCRFGGDFTLAKDPAQPYTMPAPFDGAAFAAALDFQNNVAASIREASYNPANLTSVGAATVDRSRVRLTGVAVDVPPAVVAIAPPLPDADYTVLYEAPLGVGVAATVKAGNAVTVVASAPATAELVLVRL